MSPGRKKRRRGVIALVIIVALVVVLAVAGELTARAVVPGIVADKVRSALKLPSDHPVTVGVGDQIMLLSLAQSRLDDVDISSRDVTFEALTVDAMAHAARVSFDGTMSDAVISAEITAENLLALLPADSIPIDDLRLDAGNAILSTSFAAFGATIPLSLTMQPSIADGDLLLAPQSLSIGNLDLSVDDVSSLASAAGIDTSEPIRLCLRGEIPAGVTLTSATASGGVLRVEAQIADTIATDAALQANGTCS